MVATKSLIIRPVTPRFFAVGDTAELAARGLSITGELDRTVDVPAKAVAALLWLEVEA